MRDCQPLKVPTVGCLAGKPLTQLVSTDLLAEVAVEMLALGEGVKLQRFIDYQLALEHVSALHSISEHTEITPAQRSQCVLTTRTVLRAFRGQEIVCSVLPPDISINNLHIITYLYSLYYIYIILYM